MHVLIPRYVVEDMCICPMPEYVDRCDGDATCSDDDCDTRYSRGGEHAGSRSFGNSFHEKIHLISR